MTMGALDELWSQRPGMLRKTGSPALFSQDELFAVVCDAAEMRSELPDPQDVRLFSDDHIVNPAQIQQYLPSRGREKSFAEYGNRLTRTMSSFALTVNSLQQFRWDVWRTLRREMDSIVRETGAWTAGGVDCHLIASAYNTAPTLIHKDTADVFTYVIAGTKIYYTWPYETMAAFASGEALQNQVNLPSSVTIGQYENDATVVQGGPGAVLYWPSDRWHCAASNGDPTLSVHLAHYRWDNRLDWFMRRMRKVLEAEFGLTRFTDRVRTVAETPSPPDVDSIICSSISRFAANEDFGLRATLSYLKRSSASNFEVVPPVRDTKPLCADDNLVVPQISETRHHDTPYGYFLAVNGHVMKLGGAQWLPSFTAELKPGQTMSAGEWARQVRSLGGPTETSVQLAFLREMVRRGALDVEAGN